MLEKSIYCLFFRNDNEYFWFILMFSFINTNDKSKQYELPDSYIRDMLKKTMPSVCFITNKKKLCPQKTSVTIIVDVYLSFDNNRSHLS